MAASVDTSVFGPPSPGIRSLYVSMMLCALTGAAFAGDRATSLVNSFQVMCMLEPLDFARSDAKATAMRLPVRNDMQPPPDSAGHFNHTKTWLLPLKSGPHEFTVNETRGTTAHIKGCGIGAPDVDADDFKAELTKTMRLGKPTVEKTSPDGLFRNTVWPINNLFLLLSDGSPRNLKHGVYLFVSDKPLVR